MVSMDPLKQEYLELLSKNYKNRYAAFTEIINLSAILNLPKGTEHFISDVHGEYEAFCHILNNCSGVIRDKVDYYFTQFTEEQKGDLCTLIYYPKEKMDMLYKEGKLNELWFRQNLLSLIELARYLSSKYTRSKVRRAIGHEFNYILDELLHSKEAEDNQRSRYHASIIHSIIETKSAHHFITSLCSLIKRLAVDHLHIVGDIFDRGPHPDYILDLLMSYHSLDIQWGNHDILWMGAACGSDVCVVTAVRNCIFYKCFSLLEKTYGVSIRPLIAFAEKTYTSDETYSAVQKAISIIIFKLQGLLIKRNKHLKMESRLFLDKIDYDKGTVNIEGVDYDLKFNEFPTIDRNDPYKLSQEEEIIVKELVEDFIHSKRLQEHTDFLYSHGSIYKTFNGNLLCHGCIPLQEDGSFQTIHCQGRYLKGKSYLDYCDLMARKARSTHSQESLDYMWFLWCGLRSPLSGRVIKTFERTMLVDKETYHEPRDPYYTQTFKEEVCKKILFEFGLDTRGHIINGHTPIKVKDGEKPVRANGRLVVIDGGFCKAYHKTTGIAGYTLIFSSHALILKAHKPFDSLDNALEDNSDIKSEISLLEGFEQRMMIEKTDDGIKILRNIEMLKELLKAYREGRIQEKTTNTYII